MIAISENPKWDQILNTEFNPYDDVYFRYGYFKLYQKHFQAQPEAVFWEDSHVSVIYMHLIRKINLTDEYRDCNYFDLTTPYGYGGPIVIYKSEDTQENIASIRKFYDTYRAHCVNNRYICEFTRYHPIFENYKYSLEVPLSPIYVGDVVVVDLRPDLGEIISKIKKGHKYNIRKSLQEGCSVIITSSPSKTDIQDFMQCYNSMLSMRSAAQKYYFSFGFIEDHFKLFDSVLIKILFNDTCIGAGIFIKGNKILHYHLSGSSRIKGVYPTDMIIFEAIKWAKNKHLDYLHLGGGLSKDDSLFNFKSGFSEMSTKFYIGKNVYLQNVYNQLVNGSSTGGSSEAFFPAYRLNYNDTIV